MRKQTKATKILEAKKNLEKFSHTPHCSSCGAQNPAQNDGYTYCCNKRVCYGADNDYQKDYFGNTKVVAHACCWGMADAIFTQHRVKTANGMSMLTSNELVY